MAGMHRVKSAAKNANLHAQETAEKTQKGRRKDAERAFGERCDAASETILRAQRFGERTDFASFAILRFCLTASSLLRSRAPVS
jgi:hypothetical protein